MMVQKESLHPTITSSGEQPPSQLHYLTQICCQRPPLLWHIFKEGCSPNHCNSVIFNCRVGIQVWEIHIFRATTSQGAWESKGFFCGSKELASYLIPVPFLIGRTVQSNRGSTQAYPVFFQGFMISTFAVFVVIQLHAASTARLFGMPGHGSLPNSLFDTCTSHL